MRILILGGTTESARLAQRLAGDTRFAPTLSLAGRTAAPAAPPIAYRIGGFGGMGALRQWLRDEGIEAVIDATHPFAAQISKNAVAAAKAESVPLLSLLRPAWAPQQGDRWIEVADMDAAAAALGEAPRRVFLTIGRQEVAAFEAAPQHRYLIRSIEAPQPEDLPPNAELLLARGPFDEAAETALLRERSIDILVSKNSGGAATAPKLAAARSLNLPVVMVQRPEKPAGVHSVADAEAALAWLEALRAHRASPSERAV
ncbi:cobalt-precorrin-6A reductase [Methyloligella sp. 2.7D]|uniref:cobalt-precorrin-6A reductase n=1 Tax=unclassified Methyloligella TaxID=2625955 RepID=UPI00157C711A|nr:cobalt-precorrin-6A reductase [Methyloligella sp. GL2]QKP78181.1 cobalt-precorrin-6A reductase [Methyloligella sp. GL2]